MRCVVMGAVGFGLVVLGCKGSGETKPAPAAASASASTSTGARPPAFESNDPSITVKAAAHPGGFTHCRTRAGAMAVAPVPKLDATLDCPVVILDTNRSPSLRGTIDVAATTARRAIPTAAKDECCYVISGR